MSSKRIYKVIFNNQGSVYEIYARQVTQGSMYAFVEVAEIIFGERSKVVLDPAEEKLKSEFSGVERTFIPLHAVIRIDQVEKEGLSKVIARDGKKSVTPFPLPYPPTGGKQE